MRVNFSGALQGAAIGALLLASVPPALAQDSINVLVSNERTASVYPVLLGRGFGFFEAEGLEVNFLSSATTVPYVAFLNNGDADLVMLDAPQTLQAVNSNLPVSLVYEAMQYAPEGIVVPAESEIQELAELKGKTIGLASDRDLTTTTIALESIGLSADDVRTVVVGDAGPTIVMAFRNGSIDAFAGGSVDRFGMEAAGLPFRDITPPAVSENPANSFVIWNDRKEELRDVVTRFLRAWTKATEAAQVDIEAARAVAKEQVPEQWEDPDFGRRLLDYAATTTHKPRTELRGQPQPEVWKAVQPALVRLGELQAEVDPATFLDDSFIEAANDYETADVEAAIAAWKEANPDKL